jgi:hypothetical protein
MKTSDSKSTESGESGYIYIYKIISMYMVYGTVDITTQLQLEFIRRHGTCLRRCFEEQWSP